MSLGQLIAYADSDAEDEYFDDEDSKSTPNDTNISATDVKSDNNINNDEIKDDTATKIEDASPAAETSTTDPLTLGLSGIIEDEDDDRPSAADKPPSSPPPLRVGELRTEEGGGSSRASPASIISAGSSKNTPTKKKKINRLVSYYNEDDDMEDSSESDEETDEVLHSEPMDTGSTDGDDTSSHTLASAPSHPSSPHNRGGAVVVDGIKLPPPPPGKKCSNSLQERVTRALAEVERGYTNYNAKIQCKKEFRNPSIYEKLVQHLRLDENGTNYPLALYDPHCWGKESFYESLAKVQKEEMEKREKDKKDRTKVDFVSGTKKSAGEEEIKKRKSRFDSGRPDGATGTTSVTKPVSLVSNISTSSLGSKTTIDAFGSLSKKVKT